MASDGKSETKSENDRANQNDKRKEKTFKKPYTRYEPYGRRHKVFVTNIPFDVKWQALKDLIKELVGEVTYVELITDAEGKSRGCAAVEFKAEETLKKAMTVLNNHTLSGRPLKAKEDQDGEHARRVVQKMLGGIGGAMGGPMGIGGMVGPMGIGGPLGVGGPNGMGGPLGPGLAGPGVPIPPSILNNPSISKEIIYALQTGRLGSSVFVANLDFSVNWKKLKEVFSMAGVVTRAEILDKEGKSRGIGTVTFEQPIEAVQAISMFNGQLLFDRAMVVKMDDKSMPKVDLTQLPRGLAGIGMGLGPGGQPIDAHLLNRGGAMVPGGLDGIGFGMNKMAGLDGPFGANGAGIGLDRGIALDRAIGLDRGIDRFATSGMSMGRLPDNILDVERATGAGFERDLVRSGMTMSGSYGDALDRVMSSGSALSSMDRLSTGLGPGIDRMTAGLGHGLDRVPSDIDRLGLVIDRLGSSGDRMSSSGLDRLGSLGMEAMAPSVERMGHSMDRMSSVERMGSGMGYGVERMGSTLERVASALDRIGSVDRMASSGMDRMGVGIVSSSMDRMGSGIDRMGQVMDRLSSPVDRMASGSIGRMGLDRVGASAIDRLGPGMGQPMGSGIDRIGLGMGMGVGFDRPMDMDRANFGGGFGGGFGGTASATPVGPRKGCQIFVRNLSFDFTWKMLKDKFIECGHVVYADIKMENGKSKGCGVVKFDSPESAERACRLMNGIKLGGREIDVRMDRNA